MRIYMSFFLIVVVNGLYSQPQSTYVNTGSSTRLIQSNPVADNDRMDIKYLTDEWATGSLISNENYIISNVRFKYNVSEDKFEIRADVNPETVSRIHYNKQVFFYTSFYYETDIDEGYLELLSEGPVKLLLRHDVKRTPGRKGAFGYEASQNLTKQYFIKVKDDPAIAITRRKKDILEVLNGNNEILNRFIKENNLNLRKNNDIKLLLDYFGEITD